jgi:type II secretion system protein I
MTIQWIRSRAHTRAGTAARPSIAGQRRGFTLVELLVAVTIFTVGVLALASTAGTVAMMVGTARRQNVAALAALSRFDRLRSTPCKTLSPSGSASSQTITESWTVSDSSSGKVVVLTVSYPVRSQTKSQTYRAFILCK